MASIRKAGRRKREAHMGNPTVQNATAHMAYRRWLNDRIELMATVEAIASLDRAPR